MRHHQRGSKIGDGIEIAVWSGMFWPNTHPCCENESTSTEESDDYKTTEDSRIISLEFVQASRSFSCVLDAYAQQSLNPFILAKLHPSFSVPLTHIKNEGLASPQCPTPDWSHHCYSIGSSKGMSLPGRGLSRRGCEDVSLRSYSSGHQQKTGIDSYR